MEVLMTNSVPRIGKKGDFKDVAEGFARNYLFPRNLAVPATKGAKKNFELVKTAWEKQVARERQAFTDMAEKVDGLVVTVTKRAGDTGRLFGSITSAELVEAIKSATGVEVDKKLVIADHIKEVGEHSVVVRFSGDIKANLKVVVEAEVQKD